MSKLLWTMAGIGAAGAIVTFASAAGIGPTDADGAHKLIEHGDIGLMALIVIVLLAPIIAERAYSTRKLTEMFRTRLEAFDNHLAAQQGERERMAEQHLLERQEAAKAELAERKQRFDALQALTTAQTTALVNLGKSLTLVCANLEGRPCIANERLLAEEE